MATCCVLQPPEEVGHTYGRALNSVSCLVREHCGDDSQSPFFVPVLSHELEPVRTPHSVQG